MEAPGGPRTAGSDSSSFLCARAPAFDLSSQSFDYNPYTWHTNRDTYDKISWDDVRRNAAMVAMLAYLASEEPERLPRDRVAQLPPNPQTGQPREWPTCQEAARSAAQSTR